MPGRLQGDGVDVAGAFLGYPTPRKDADEANLVVHRCGQRAHLEVAIRLGVDPRKADQMDLKLVFKKDNMMEFHVAIGDAGCVLTAKYTRDKDGTVTAEVTDFEKKGDFPVVKEKGYKFSFKWEPGDKKAKLSELRGDDIQDEQRQAVEGEYEAKSD